MLLISISKDNKFSNFNIMFQKPKPNLEASNYNRISIFNNKNT